MPDIRESNGKRLESDMGIGFEGLGFRLVPPPTQ